MKKLEKNRHIGDRLQLSAAILAQWQRPVTSIKALDHLYQAMHGVLYRRISTAVKTASNYGTFFIVVLFAVTLAAAGIIQREYSPGGGVQWLPG
jgi:hypothetical protein